VVIADHSLLTLLLEDCNCPYSGEEADESIDPLKEPWKWLNQYINFGKLANDLKNGNPWIWILLLLLIIIIWRSAHGKRRTN
jgi:hypothetical protein